MRSHGPWCGLLLEHANSLAVFLSSRCSVHDLVGLEIPFNPQSKVSIVVPLASLDYLCGISYPHPCRLCVPYFPYDQSSCAESGISVASLGQRA